VDAYWKGTSRAIDPAISATTCLSSCALIRRWTTEIAVTDRRIILKRGFIRRHTVEMNMQKVESVDVDQTRMRRIFGCVTIRGIGSSFENLSMVDSRLKLRTTITAG
jgi:uncharacterized membrane protein YdbT with pleckstrin-like domain